jgi:acyl-homoserine-lactone acylase
MVVCVACACAASGQGGVYDDPLVLWQQVTLYRDAWGVPHIYGDTPRALAFAFGYAQAEDHLAQMLLAYRVANGRAAEVFGEPYAASDEFAIRMGHADLAEKALRAADPVTRDLCEGFAMGANAWWIEHIDQVPAWADGVRPADILALLHCYLMSFAPFDHPTAWHRAPAATTGNAWAIGPARSQSGNPLLVINPHSHYSGPFQWYEAHLVCGDMNIAGGTLFGLPVILMGHNGALGWALTPNHTDNADIYVEHPPKFNANPANPMTAQHNPELLFYLSTFADARTFYVNTPTGMQERLVRKLDTGIGPVVAEDGMTFYSYKAGGYFDFGAVRQLVEMARAQNLPSFKAALAMQQLPCFHVVYADKGGNIFYLYNSKAGFKADPTPRRPPPPEQAANPLSGIVTGRASFPDGGRALFQNRQQVGPYVGDADEIAALLHRSGPAPWTTPMDAQEPLYAWGATIPITHLPFIENPISGYVQACGNPPWTATTGADLYPWDWPSWLVRDRDTYRARRVRHLLEMGPRSFNDCQAMLFDVVAPFAVEAVPLILQAARENPIFVASAHPDLPVTLNLLEDWNGTADPASPAMTFFHLWWSALRSQTFPTLDSESELFTAVRTGAPEMQQRMLTAANDATKLLRNEYNAVSVPWGAVHQLQRGARTVEAPGAISGEPLLVAEDRQRQGSYWPVTYGYGFSMVVEFGDTARAASLVPFGSSENPESPHYDDQLTLFTQRRLKPARFEIEDVQRHASVAYGRSIILRASGIVGYFRLEADAPVMAQMQSDYTPPAPLPEGLVPFTVFAEAISTPPHVPGRLTMEIYIPDVLCEPQHLSRLRIYRHGEQGWERLGEQTLDAASRTVAGISSRSGVFAVLGPAEYRTTQIAGDTDEPAADAPSSGGVLARLQPTPPTSPMVLDTSADKPILIDPRTGELADVQLGQPRFPAVTPDLRPTAPLVPATGPRDEGPRDEAGPREAARNFNMDLPEAAPGAPATPESRGAQAPAEDAPAPASGERREPRIEVEWKPGGSLIPTTPELQMSDTLRGKSIDFRPPNFDGLFRITARRVITAQMRLTTQPPAALPGGLAAFTPFAEILHSNITPKPEVAILISIPADKCATENLGRLAIYSFDPQNGWQELPLQNLDGETRSISVLDQPPRLYAVLGPVECLLR